MPKANGAMCNRSRPCAMFLARMERPISMRFPTFPRARAAPEEHHQKCALDVGTVTESATTCDYFLRPSVRRYSACDRGHSRLVESARSASSRRPGCTFHRRSRWARARRRAANGSSRTDTIACSRLARGRDRGVRRASKKWRRSRTTPSTPSSIVSVTGDGEAERIREALEKAFYSAPDARA